MDVTFVAAIAVLLTNFFFAMAVTSGRCGTTKAHHMAFRAGLAGLIAFPIWFLGLIGLALQLLFTDFWSVPGVLFALSSVTILVALGYSAFAWVRLKVNQKRSAPRRMHSL
ncbi:MAG TPA: hypothetical protein VFS99_02895 [Xanthomonadaceae bacterium]|nr:hypothetical protein [Xanthomonadaceae bacterium]